MAGWKKCSQSHYRPRTDDQFCCQIKVKIMYYQSFRLFFLLNMVLLPMIGYSQELYGDYIDQAQKIAQEIIITEDRKSTRLNSSHVAISYAVFCLKKKTQT